MLPPLLWAFACGQVGEVSGLQELAGARADRALLKGWLVWALEWEPVCAVAWGRVVPAGAAVAELLQA